MAPTIPADAITISSSLSEQPVSNTLVILSSSGSDQPVSNTLVDLTSATFSSRSVAILPDPCASRGGGDQARDAPRNRRPHSTAPCVVPVLSSTVVTAASFADGSGAEATSRRRPTAAARQQCPSPRSVLSVRAPGGVAPAPAPPSSGGGDDEATSRPKRKARYRKWGIDDERKVLATLAELRRDNMGVLPQVSVLLKKLCANGGLVRRGVDAIELSDKVYKLKKKYVKAAAKFAASGGRRIRKYRNQELYEISMEVWPELMRGENQDVRIGH
ncbi:hypothetical protein Zm00014a_002446 [Zea mays]|uniref:Glabrous enhancer-binding protein-like DBD domain-containing protein n=1 Tax=Zea mays TaxID=4577 RepID=A0A3L6EFP7_MAIZE|nr:hypothetical protein Zm00014a_002446 [Zea mays]